jgi:hypothetical protein
MSLDRDRLVSSCVCVLWGCTVHSRLEPSSCLRFSPPVPLLCSHSRIPGPGRMEREQRSRARGGRISHLKSRRQGEISKSASCRCRFWFSVIAGMCIHAYTQGARLAAPDSHTVAPQRRPGPFFLLWIVPNKVLSLSFRLSFSLSSEPCVCVYYCRAYYKAVRLGGEGDSGGHELREPRPVWTSLPITH